MTRDEGILSTGDTAVVEHLCHGNFISAALGYSKMCVKFGTYSGVVIDCASVEIDH